MGTDIHGGFIKITKDSEGVVTDKQPVKWAGFSRDYTLFAILADVRNGYGFAGTYRHEPLQPITSERGIPDFIDVVDGVTKDLYNQWYGVFDGEEEEFGEYIGDHSYTYMTVDEILSWEGWSNKLSRGGVLTIPHYHETVAVGLNPEAWCGGISGDAVLVAESEEDYKTAKIIGIDHNYTHVRCCWVDGDTLGEEYTWFLEEVKRIKNQYGGDTYLVVGFDS